MIEIGGGKMEKKANPLNANLETTFRRIVQETLSREHEIRLEIDALATNETVPVIESHIAWNLGECYHINRDVIPESQTLADKLKEACESHDDWKHLNHLQNNHADRLQIELVICIRAKQRAITSPASALVRSEKKYEFTTSDIAFLKMQKMWKEN